MATCPMPSSLRTTAFRFPKGRTNDVRQVPQNVGMVIQAALRQVELANPDLFAGSFGDVPWTNRERLDALVETLDGLPTSEARNEHA